jgi:prophage regulatory protein
MGHDPAEIPDPLICGWAALSLVVRRSRWQLWRDIRLGRFPAPIELGPNSVAWRRTEVEAWLASRPRRTYASPAAAA